MPQTWIFQGNPDAFDIDGYLAAGLDRITWGMRQRSAEVRVGDRVYIWRAAGAQKADSGIIASGVDPTMRSSA